MTDWERAKQAMETAGEKLAREARELDERRKASRTWKFWRSWQPWQRGLAGGVLAVIILYSIINLVLATAAR
jgi:hypothetical protein